MNKQLFIRYETPDGKSWADALASLNVYSTNPGVSAGLADIKDYNQQVNRYRRMYYKMSVFKTVSENPATFLSIGYPTEIVDQTVTIKSIDTDFIFSKLATGKYQTVYFAFYFGDNPEGAGDLDVITKSNYYARNVETGNFENLATGAVITEENPSFSFWYNVSRMGNTEIYYMVINPEMVVVPYDIEGMFGGVDYRLLDNQNGTFGNAVFNPSVTGGVMIGKNIIVAESNTVVIDTLGNSALHGFSGNKIPKDQLPKIELDVLSSAPYNKDNNLVTVDVSSKPVSYVKIKWVTKSNLDFPTISLDESITENFVIIKS